MTISTSIFSRTGICFEGKSFRAYLFVLSVESASLGTLSARIIWNKPFMVRVRAGAEDPPSPSARGAIAGWYRGKDGWRSFVPHRVTKYS